MCKPRFANVGAHCQEFASGYAEAQRLVLAENDLDGALLCLYRVRPTSQPDLWQWTDLVAALLCRKGDYEGSMDTLTGYCMCFPGDRFAESSIQMLKQWLGRRQSESEDS